MTGALADAFTEEAHLSAARTALGSARPDRTVTAVEPLGRGNRKRTFVADVDGGDRVVLQLSEDESRLRSEALVLDAVAERTGVPVPPVLSAGTADGVGYLVTDHVAGGDLHERFAGFDAAGQRALARSFGRYLAELHRAFAFDGYGSLVADGDRLRAPGDRGWADWLSWYGRAAVDRLPEAFDGVRPALLDLLADPSVEPVPTARLYPWDFRPGNALVADGEVAAVLDWESPLAADPALSVATAEYLVADWYVADPEPLRSAFAAGYESVRPYPTVEPVHRAVAVADSAVDSNGVVTNPRYPELDREGAVAFHREALEAVV